MIQHLKLATRSAQVIALLAAVLALLIAFGVHITDTQLAAITGVVAALLRMAGGKA